MVFFFKAALLRKRAFELMHLAGWSIFTRLERYVRLEIFKNAQFSIALVGCLLAMGLIQNLVGPWIPNFNLPMLHGPMGHV